MRNQSRFNPKTRNYYKRNFDEAVEKVVPYVYYDEDRTLSGVITDPTSELINSHIRILKNVSSVLYVSALENTIYSSIDNVSGMAPFFVKQNNLSEFTTFKFEKDILVPLGSSLNDFQSSAEFATFVSSFFIPNTRLNGPVFQFDSANSDTSAQHKYLIDKFNWLYFLNTSADGGLAFEPSNVVRDLLISKIYRNKDILINDCIKGFEEFVWKNYETCTAWQTSSLVPKDYQPSALLSVQDNYTSGVQPLDRLNSLIDVVYSPLFTDRQDTAVKDALDAHISSSTYLSDELVAGPFTRLLKAFSFMMFDVNNTVETLGILKDITDVPDALLPKLADLIGWKLFGHDPDRWRLQLVNAVDIYKRAGTKHSLQFAINAVFSPDVYNLSSTITELWESYIPFLMYYALATESVLLQDYTTWTPQVSRDLGVSGYSTSSMDTNIRLAVDAIMLDLVKEFPDHFNFAGRQGFPLGDPDFMFHYRERTYPVPPFEEHPYYVNADITEQIADAIADKLVCFGVPKWFALDVRKYILDNSLRASDDIRVGNSWLLFTSGYNQPTNWGSIIQDISNKNSEYMSLWSGKSSHYKIVLEASSFNFAKDTIESDSSRAVSIIRRITDEFSPAHAIPSILLKTSATDDYFATDIENPYINWDPSGKPGLSLRLFGSFGTSGTSMGGYHRNKGGTVWNRRTGQADDIGDQFFASANPVEFGRVSFRRRSYKKILPMAGYYDRTGFNMPCPWDMTVSTAGTQAEYPSSLGFIPLGLIPSAGAFLSVSDHVNLPTVYNSCQTPEISNQFSGVSVSSCFPCRGVSALGTNDKMPEITSATAWYADRGQTPPIVAAMHSIKEKAKALLAELTASADSNYSFDVNNLYWKDETQSYANYFTNTSGDFPLAVSSYWAFEFGRRLQQLYDDYTDNFARHTLRKDLLYLDGPNIFAHTFGSIFRNSKFDKYGTAWVNDKTIVASSADEAVKLGAQSIIFSTSGIGASGTQVASATSSMYIDRYEFRNPTILSGVEMIHTSGSSDLNAFTIYNIDESFSNPNRSNYPIENPIVKIKAVDGWARLKYDTALYNNPSDEGHPDIGVTIAGMDSTIRANMFTPNHEFSINLKALASNDDGTRFGGLTLGVWIHTPVLSERFWTYSAQEQRWIMEHYSNFNSGFLVQHAYKYRFPERERELPNNGPEVTGTRFQCIDFINPNNPRRDDHIILSFSEDDFTNIRFDFNTKNKPILVPEEFFKDQGVLHDKNRNYVIEIFVIPTQANRDKFLLLDEISVRDETDKKYSEFLVSGTTNGKVQLGDNKFCRELRSPLTREELREIFKFFGDIAGAHAYKGYASRDATITSGMGFQASGGSRIDYREHPVWHPATTNASVLLITTLTVPY